jgi:hypothetical protein
MYIYEVLLTIKNASENRLEDWREYMIKKHIPDVLNTGSFHDFSFRKLVANGKPLPEHEQTYEIQYYYRKPDDFSNYENLYKNELMADHSKRFEDLDIHSTRSNFEDETFRVLAAVISGG